MQFLYLVWVCVHFACRAKEDTHIFMANCPSWRIRSLAHSHPGGLQLLWIKMNGFKTGKEPTDIPTCCWLVVSNIFYFHPYLGTWSNLTNIFQRGWNHQLEKNQQIFNMLVFLVVSASVVSYKNSLGSTMRWSKVPWPLRTAVEALKRWNFGVGLWRLVDELIGMIWWWICGCFSMITSWLVSDGEVMEMVKYWKEAFPPKKSFQPLEFSSEKKLVSGRA